MNAIKNFIEDLGIAAFEANIKIAGFAVISESGKVVYQTENWDISKQTKVVLEVVKGGTSFTLNGENFRVVETSNNGIIASSTSGMGHVLFNPFQGGLLVSYAMPQADTASALIFLKNNAQKLSGKL